MEISSTLAALFLSAALGESLYYFYAQANDEASRQNVVRSSYAASILAALALWLPGHFAAGPIAAAVLGSAQYAAVVKVAAFATALSLPIEVGFSYRRAANRSTSYSVLQVLRMLVQATAILAFIAVWRLGYMGMVLGTALSFALMALYFIVVDLARTGVRLDTALAMRMLRFGSPLGVTGFALLFMQIGDRYFLRWATVGMLAVVGIYSIAYKASVLVAQAQQAFGTYWGAQLYTVLGEDGGDRQYVRVATYYFLAISSVAVVAAAAARPAFALVIPETFHAAIPLIPLLCGAHVLRAMADFFRSPVLFAGRSTLVSRFTVIAAVFCAAAYASLIPAFTLWGAAWATFLSYAFLCVISYRYAQRLSPHRFEYARIARIAILATASLLVDSLARPSGLPMSLAASAGAIALFAAGLLLTGFFDESEKAIAQRGIAALLRNRARPRFGSVF